MQGAIRYKVTVTAIVERVEKTGNEWTTIAHEPVEGIDKLKPIMGYTPEIEKTVLKEIQVFEQRVDQLDMAALVSVVNNLGQK